jgi:hypothetical protein
MTENRIDRRKSSRINANLKLEVELPRAGGAADKATLETINISSSGVYFKSGHFIAPMTKLAMEFEVSVPGDSGADAVEMAPVPCEGLVVRTQPETETDGCDEYEIAVFFTHIEAEGAAILEKHIALLMADPS